MQDHSMRYKIAMQDSYLAEQEFLISMGIIGVPVDMMIPYEYYPFPLRNRSSYPIIELYRKRWDRAFQDFMRVSEIDNPFARWWYQFVLLYTLYRWASKEHYFARSDIAMYSQKISSEQFFESVMYHETILSLEELGWNLAYHFPFVHFLYRGR